MELFWYNKSCACDNGRDTAGLCKGSTTDSDSVCEGSNPSPAAKKTPANRLVSFFYSPYSKPSPAATKTLKPQRLQGFLYMENHWLGQRVKRDYGDRYEKETPYSVYTKASQESILPRKASGNKMPDQAPSFDGASSV